MTLIVLLRLRFKRISNDLKLSFNKTRFIGSYMLLLLTIFLFNRGLYIFLFKVTDFRETFQLFGSFWNINVIKELLLIWFVYSIIKGLISDDFVENFDDADTLMMFSSPVSRKSIYLSNYFIGLIKRISIVILFFISINPIFILINLNIIETYILFFITVFYIEINYILSDISFLFFRCGVFNSFKKNFKNNHIWTLFITSSLILTSIIFFSSKIKIIINKVNLIYILIDTIEYYLIESIYINKIFNNLIIIFFIYLSFILISHILSNNFDYNIVEFINSTKKRRPVFFISTFEQIYLNNKNYFYPIFIKDILLYLREHGKILTIKLIMNYGILLLLLIRLNILEDISNIFKSDNIIFYITPSMIVIVLLNLYSPSAEILKNEVNTIWLLKTSTLSINSFLMSKYYFSILKSLIFAIPLLISIYISTPYNKIIIAFLIFNAIFIYNFIGILISSLFIFDTNNFFADTFIYHFIQIFISFIITTFYAYLIFLHPGTILLILILVITLTITEYNIQNNYLVIDFMTKFNIVWILSIYLIGLAFVFIASRAQFISITLSDIYNFSLFYIISSIITYNIFRVSTLLTVRNIVEHDDFQI